MTGGRTQVPDFRTRVGRARGGRGRVARSVAALLAALLVIPFAGQRATADTAGVVLADFETPESLRGVTLAAPDVDQVVQSTAFASHGTGSLRFEIAGSASTGSTVFPRVWLEDGSTLMRADWSGYTYLRVGVLNASSEPTTLYVVVRDKAGRYHQAGLPATPFAFRVFQIRISAIAAAGVDLSDLLHIQVSAARSPNPRSIYVDDIQLAGSLVDEAAEQDRTAPQVISAMGLSVLVSDASGALRAVERQVPRTPSSPDVALRAAARDLRARVDAFTRQIPQLGKDLATAQSILAELGVVQWRIKRLSTSVDARRARRQAPVGVGFADSMSLVYPRDLPCQCTWDDGAVQLARGEYENIQLVAIPYLDGLSGARVVAAVRGRSRGLGVTVHPVASLNLQPPVEARPGTPTAYRPSLYQGWTPDPILADRSSVDVAGDDYQAFWVQIHAATGTRPGQYKVDLTLTAGGLRPQHADVDVTVWDVAIQDRPALRTAIGNDPQSWAKPYGVTDPEGIARVNEAKWRTLADFKIQPDNIYRSIYGPGHPPTVDELRDIQHHYGGLRQFNIWYFDPRPFDLSRPETWDAQADQIFDLIQPYVDAYRAAGLIDYAYLYCCDETRATHLQLVKHVLTRFKNRFSDIEVLSTYVDDRMGQTTGLDHLIDYWVRDVPWLAPDIIQQRHAAGDEAWWYLHAGNRNPYPNLFVGYDPGQLRTLLGPMAFQAKVDGFLYYRVDRLQGQPLLTDGPLSTWDPRTWNNVAGDGSLLYPGRNGPLPSIRIQNFRDGMEDYNLLVELREAIDHAPHKVDRSTLALAQRLLAARDVVTDQTTYVRDPAAYRVWRSRVGNVIEKLS